MVLNPFYIQFEGVGCILISLKLLYSLNDQYIGITDHIKTNLEQSEIQDNQVNDIINWQIKHNLPQLEELISHIDLKLQKLKGTGAPLWRIQEIENLETKECLNYQIKFAEENIYDRALKKSEDADHKIFKGKVGKLSEIFSKAST